MNKSARLLHPPVARNYHDVVRTSGGRSADASFSGLWTTRGLFSAKEAEWRPQTKFDADRINKIVGGGVNDRESVKIVELDDEDEYDEDYEDDETYGYDDKDESKRKSHNAKYGSY
ncbi:uncharacterized protein isoform X2 [Choristoneura fumiferana]|uniref:uncharacterized protein isoform X2 n=1 Tax=Choristoneura fumiferana TaxID=7141 RepID=UPI003D155915